MNSIKICRVCGGIATGFNYEALSCESCKVFFCRNYARIETLKCKYDGNCKINFTIRKKCQKCRLVKCFAIGMLKKAIEHNIKENLVSSVENKVPNRIELMLEIHILKNVYENGLEQSKDYDRNHNEIQQIQKRRLPLELNHYELECITEARNAFRLFREEHTSRVTRQINNIQEFVNSQFFHNLSYIKKSINFCQNFSAFNSLSSDDQFILLKPFCLNLMEIWFAFQYDPKKDGFFAFTDESETKAVFIGRELWMSCTDQNVTRKLTKFSFSLYDALENDIIIRDLMATLVLFKTQHNLTCPENIRYQYYLYSSILQRYLHWKCQNRKEGNRKYLALMHLLKNFNIHFIERKKSSVIESLGENAPTAIKELYDLA